MTDRAKERGKGEPLAVLLWERLLIDPEPLTRDEEQLLKELLKFLEENETKRNPA